MKPQRSQIPRRLSPDPSGRPPPKEDSPAIRTRIVGTGSYAPPTVLTNRDLERMVDTSDTWILERTGIRERRIASHDEAASDLAREAARHALRMADVRPKELDLILVATSTPDMIFPSTACVLQKMLGAKQAAAFDLSAACSGFLYGLAVADQFLRCGTYKKVLLVGSEIFSRIVDWQDRATCVLFGDGAGAVVLQVERGRRGLLSTHLHSDGTQGHLLYVPAGGSRIPTTPKSLEEGLHFVKMKGNETFRVAVRALESVVTETLQNHGLTPSAIDLLIPHQANLRIIRAMAARLGLPMDRVVVNLDRYGNTSAASIPMALDEAVRDGRVQPGHLILFEAFGGGLTWASALYRW